MENRSVDGNAGPAPQRDGESRFYYWPAKVMKSEAFVPINSMRSTCADSGDPSHRLSYFQPLLHLHAPHVAFATKPVIPHVIFSGVVGVCLAPSAPGTDSAARNLF